MKNIIFAIVLVLSSNLFGQMKYNSVSEPSFINHGNNYSKILDSNGIFYIGILDRKLLNEGQEGFEYKNKRSLDSFEVIYGNDELKTFPDTNNYIMSEYELIKDLDFKYDIVKDGLLFGSKDNKVFGLKSFKTPNSKVYESIILYEVLVKVVNRGVLTQAVDTYMLGKNIYGQYEFVPSWVF